MQDLDERYGEPLKRELEAKWAMYSRYVNMYHEAVMEAYEEHGRPRLLVPEPKLKAGLTRLQRKRHKRMR